MEKLHSYFYVLAVLPFLSAIVADERSHKKRQIYREEVLPHAGGKIPDTAFETDRLFLNRLQTEGISIPDGIVPEQRTPHVYPFQHKSPRTVYHIALSSDARYTPKEGRFHYQDVPSVETTYLYPQIHGQQIDFKPSAPAYPVYKPIQLHNPQLNQVKLQPRNKAKLVNVAPSSRRNRLNSYKIESYANVNLINVPAGVKPPPRKTANQAGVNRPYLPNYAPSSSSHLFNEFDQLFNNFDLHESKSHYFSGAYPTA